MKRLKIESQNAPKPIGPYSQAIVVGEFVYISGQIPVNSLTGLIAAGGIENQTRQVLDNLAAVLGAAGSSLDKVIKTTVYLKNMDDFSAMNQIYGTYFTVDYPARSCVEVARLPKDVLVEIEAIAII